MRRFQGADAFSPGSKLYLNGETVIVLGYEAGKALVLRTPLTALDWVRVGFAWVLWHLTPVHWRLR